MIVSLTLWLHDRSVYNPGEKVSRARHGAAPLDKVMSGVLCFFCLTHVVISHIYRTNSVVDYRILEIIEFP